MKRLLDMRDGTKELNILRALDTYQRPFSVVGSYRLIDDGLRPEATVIIKAGKAEMHEASTGVGPVDALANVLKKSLGSIFPFLDDVKLVDFASRISDTRSGTLPGSKFLSSSPTAPRSGVSPLSLRTSIWHPLWRSSMVLSTPF